MTVLPIQTQRLTLIAADAQLARADADDQLGERLSASVPTNWPPDEYGDARDLFARSLEARPDLQGWLVWYWVLTESNTLIGAGGFRGKPDHTGTIETGYSSLTQFHGLGYATEAVGAMVRHAFTHPETRRVIAMTRRDNLASVRVLEKNGFVWIGPGDEPETSEFERPRNSAAAAEHNQ